MAYVAILLLWHALAAAIPAQPRSVPARLLGLWWVASWIGQAFALPLMLVAGAVAAFGARDGEMATFLPALAASVLSAFVHWRNRRAARLLLAAVGLPDRVPWHAGLWPIAHQPKDVRRITDIAYDAHGWRTTLDLIMPCEPPAETMPILVHVHGGAWITGRKNQQAKPLIHHLARRGWLIADINYRLGPAHRLPVQVTDVLRAIAWVRAHAAEHGGDPTRIAVTGGSAGGHLTAMAALAHDDPALRPGFGDADCSVQAAVPLYGRFDMLDRARRAGRNHDALTRFATTKFMPGPPGKAWRAVSPIDRLRTDAPPMLVIHGGGDVLLPHEESAEFARGVGAAGLMLPGIEHAYDIAASAATWGHVRAVTAWLEAQIGPSVTSARAPSTSATVARMPKVAASNSGPSAS
jgi:acetyl esterase/lipase